MYGKVSGFSDNIFLRAHRGSPSESYPLANTFKFSDLMFSAQTMYVGDVVTRDTTFDMTLAERNGAPN
jgi:hypothetical protein